jgi:hypothetical protein
MIKICRILCVAFFASSFSSSALTQVQPQEAPLGLTWGSTTNEIQGRGVELKDFSGSDFGKSFIATKIERALADQSAALLSFGFNDKLWRIVITSKNFSDDPMGSTVLSRYSELSSVLSEKYGKPRESHRLGDSIYSQPRYFISGIQGGHTNWFSNFETPNLFVQLSITASDSSTSSWRLIYENKIYRKDFEASKRSREKGSL